jgi:hypothetical protein
VSGGKYGRVEQRNSKARGLVYSLLHQLLILFTCGRSLVTVQHQHSTLIMSPATTENQINALRGMEKAGTVMIADTADFSVC